MLGKAARSRSDAALWHLPVALLALIGALLPLPAAGETAEAQLVMLVRPGCHWCRKWETEIGPAYPRSAEGRRAPLRRVDVTGPWPKDLEGVTVDAFTPTFVLVHRGREIGRLRGYPGDLHFWPLLQEILAGLP